MPGRDAYLDGLLGQTDLGRGCKKGAPAHSTQIPHVAMLATMHRASSRGSTVRAKRQASRRSAAAVGERANARIGDGIASDLSDFLPPTLMSADLPAPATKHYRRES
jgi:hypothetical protein